MRDRVLALTLLAGLSGALQTSFCRTLSTAAPAGGAPARFYSVLIVQVLQLLAVGAVTAVAAAPRTRWPVLVLTGALVGVLGQGLASLYVGADAFLLIPAALTTAAGALLYRLLLPAPAERDEEQRYA